MTALTMQHDGQQLVRDPAPDVASHSTTVLKAGVSAPRADATSTQRHVLLLAAHGSSFDALARERVRAHADRVAALVPHDEVRVGFARGAPGIADAVRDLAVRDLDRHTFNTTLTVVPFMTSAGHYCERVMPALLRDVLDGSDTRVLITKPVGSSRRVTAILLRRALRLAVREGWAPADTALLVVGHGTPRHPASRATALAHARSLQRFGWGSVCAAFIDDTPTIADTVNALPQRKIIVLPFLIGGASHALIDVPEALGVRTNSTDRADVHDVGGRSLLLDAAIGVDDALADIAADLATRMWSRATMARSRHANAVASDAGVSGGARTRTRLGSVHLVGAGPGAPDLITVRGQRLLQRADVVIHDRLVSDETLALARPDAKLIDVGKWPATPQSLQTSINAQIVESARAGDRVVRLKGGDPFVFGRGSEEVDACIDAGIPVRVVPGISSALAAPAAAGIPVTARRVSRGFAVVTAATATDEQSVVEHVRDYARIDTLVVLMGRARLAAVTAQLIEAGRDANTPVACIERATLPQQRVVRGTLSTIAQIADAVELESPMVTVIGPTAHFGAEVVPQQ